jgi:hypothetical protein
VARDFIQKSEVDIARIARAPERDGDKTFQRKP